MAAVDESGKQAPECALLDPARGTTVAQGSPRRWADVGKENEISQHGPLSTLNSEERRNVVVLQSQSIQSTALSLQSDSARGRKRPFPSLEESDSGHELDIVAHDVE